MADDGPQIEFEPGSLRKLIQNSKTWDKVTRREMRAGLRAAALSATEDAKREVLGPPPANHGVRRKTPQSRGLRRGLAAGVSVSIRSGRETAGVVKGEGVRVVTTSKKLPDEQAAMVKAYMARTFRHPIFGTRYWVEQHGKNWFFNPILRHRDEYKAVISKAIRAAIDEMERG